MGRTSDLPMRPTVLLFDIDGTLVTTGGVGRRALERAFEVRYGRARVFEGIRFDGMTDRAIARLGLEQLGVEPSGEEIDAALADYVAVLEDEVRNAHPSSYRLHAGMRSAVEAGLSRGCAVGLGTGNIRVGARIKLERVEIHHHFAFGGFGCDHELRPELIRVGALRGAQRLGVPLSECRVVVIGDTPRDVAAAKEIGAECLGVGTGSFRPADLVACGATHAFEDLSDPAALRALLDG